MKHFEWDKADTGFIIFLIICWILYELVAGEAKAGEYFYSPPSTPLRIEYTIKVNGVEVQSTNSKCPKLPSRVEQEPVDFTACPKGYLCKPDSAKGKRTLRIDEEAKYKKLLEVWDMGKSSTSSGGKR